MLIKEAKEYLQSLGYKIIKEEQEDIPEEEFLKIIKEAIYKKAEEVNFEVDPEELDTLAFEAYSNDWDLETAIKQVWRGVYVEEGADLTFEVE